MIKDKIVLSFVVVGVLLSIGCAASNALSEEELGYRNSNLYKEKVELKDKVTYSDVAPGESKLIKRSFENAPPLISHSVDGLLPITKESNSCLGCHSPEVASAVKATSVPKSHLVSYRPISDMKNGEVFQEGKRYVNTSDIKSVAHEREGVSNDRYNCSQCHVPQTDNKPLVKNHFSPDFRNVDSSKKSNLADTLNEGVKYDK